VLTPTGRGLNKPNPVPGTKHSEPPARAALVRTLKNGTKARLKGDFRQATEIFQVGYRQALLEKEADLQAYFSWGIANCRFSQHRYQEALTGFLTAREIFALRGDRASVSALDGSLSSLYIQLGEYEAAIDAIKRALEQTSPGDGKGLRARHLINLATVLAQQGKMDESWEMSREAILEADRYGDPGLSSNAWDRLGSELLLRKHLPQAEDALLEAFRIRKLNHLASLGGSYRSVGLLRLEQGDLTSASALLDASIATSKSEGGRIPEWRFYHARGLVRLAAGMLPEAQEDFRLALELARNYRISVPASDATRVSFEGLLQEVYSSFVETGSQLYAETGRVGLARETFEAVEENRAGSLAARLGERTQFRRKLTPAYWDKLAQLQSAEAVALADSSEAPRETMRRLRASLIEIEAKAGLSPPGIPAGLPDRVQQLLDADTALFSFHLAQPASWLWVAGKSGLSLYRLPDQNTITSQARLFRQAVLTGDEAAEGLGRELNQKLFGAIEPQYRHTSKWLLSLDEGLFELPFAALVAGGVRHAPVYLIERHSIRIVSGAALWSSGLSRSRTTGGFAGVGDAVYNRADARWRGRTSGWLESLSGWPRKTHAAAPAALGLSRLPGSGPEIAACAREWETAPILLQGRDATKENVRRAVEAHPAVVHIAAHVLQRPEHSTDAMIALSLSDSGEDQLLGPVEVGGWSADGSLIVLSGCSSGAGPAHPGAGLMGMTRAWLMAGARAVVATAWSTPDDVGVFFSRFYQQLRRSGARDPASALQVAQIQTLRAGGWRSQPGFWAAYFALGNYQD
jgi:CHAT domain-containing protein